MKQSNKKIIAREFLILISSIVVFFIVFFLWLWLIEKNQSKENKFKNQLIELTEFKNLPYKLRIYHFIKNEIDETLNNPNEFISELNNSSIIIEKYNYLKNEGRIDKPLSTFRDSILIDNKSEKHLSKIQVVENKISITKNSFFNNDIYEDEVLGLMIALFSIFFLLRYLIYGIKWSLKQLKQ